MVGGSVGQELHDDQLIAEVVEDDGVAEQQVEHIGSIVFGLSLILHLYVLKVAHGIERGVPPQSACLLSVTLNGESVQKAVDELGGAKLAGHRMLLAGSVGKAQESHAVGYTHRCYGMGRDE